CRGRPLSRTGAHAMVCRVGPSRRSTRGVARSPVRGTRPGARGCRWGVGPAPDEGADLAHVYPWQAPVTRRGSFVMTKRHVPFRPLIASVAMALLALGVAPPTSAEVNAVTPSTNDINRTNGWAHVDQVAVGIGTTTL